MIGRGAINYGPINYGAINGDRGIVLELESSIDIALSSTTDTNMRLGIVSLHVIGLDPETLLNLVMGLSAETSIELIGTADFERTFFAKWLEGHRIIVYSDQRVMWVGRENRKIAIMPDEPAKVLHEERKVA